MKRRIGVRSIPALLKVGLIWKRAAYLLTGLYGYLPARTWRLGAENETRRLHAECVAWLTQEQWKDPRDGFDYGSAVLSLALPPGLYLAGEGDRDLGYPADVQRFIGDCAHTGGRLMVVGKTHGNRHDYDHVSLVTHPDAQNDHFTAIVEFLSTHSHSPG